MMEGEKRGEQDEALLSFVALVRIGANEVHITSSLSATNFAIKKGSPMSKTS